MPYPSVLGGLRFNRRLRLLVKVLLCVLLCAKTLIELLVRVLRKWLLHNAGDDQWLPVPVPERSNQIAVHRTDELQRYLFGTYRLTFPMVRAAAEELVSHRHHHAEGPLIALRSTLR